MRLVNILSIFSVAGILLLCLFTSFSGDDYCIKGQLSETSILDLSWAEYLNWDGRRLSIPSFVQLGFLSYLPAEFITFFWGLCFIGTSFFICKILSIENPSFQENGLSISTLGMMCVVLWLGMWKFIPDIIYWPTGGAYSLSGLLGIFWLYAFLRGLKSNTFSAQKCFLIFLLSILCGNNSHNFLTGVIVLCLIELGYHWFVNRNKNAAIYILCALFGLIAAAFIVFSAPGNYARLNALPHSDISPKLIFHYLVVLTKHAYWLWALPCLCIALILISGNRFDSIMSGFLISIKNIFRVFKSWRNFLIALYENKYLITALATMLVFATAYSFSVPRTGLFLALFLVIYIFQKGWKASRDNNSKIFYYGKIILFGGFLILISAQTYKANPLKNKLSEREKFMVQRKGIDVSIRAIDKKEIPLALTFTDISSDSSYWVNRCVAKYYGLKTVRTSSD